MTDPGDFSGRQLVLSGDTMPAPRTVVAVLRENLHRLVTEARNSRGEVHTPEDTYALIRSLMGVRDGARDYEYAFSTIRKEVDEFIQDDLELAVGEQDGVPNSGLNVPDVDGSDIAIGLDTQNNYGFDDGTLVQALIFEALEQAAEIQADNLPRDYVAWLLGTALNRLIALGQFRPQVTKVRAFADDLARREGGPNIAAAVRGSVSKTVRFRGIKVERKQGK
jgi:hypothetical protein